MPGVRNTGRAMNSLRHGAGRPVEMNCVAKLALLPFTKVIAGVPMFESITVAGRNGTALNAEPAVRISVHQKPYDPYGRVTMLMPPPRARLAHGADALAPGRLGRTVAVVADIRECAPPG